MQEAFLHYIWKYQKFESSQLFTSKGELVVVQNVGQHNFNSGPDFFNAQLVINGQLWAGNVEIHIKSSDWYVHGHEKDKAYDNVILHIVWEYDTDIFRADNSSLETLVLKPHISKQLLQNYTTLISNTSSWINCEDDISSIDAFVIDNWLERLFIERLERKSQDIEIILKASNNDWEAVLFKLLAKNFGLKVNGDAFLSLASSIDFSIVRKLQHNVLDLEALFFGQADLLNTEVQEPFHQELKERYTFIKHKFQLDNLGVLPVQFFRLRPPNFPTIRLSQLGKLYNDHANLFSKVIATGYISEFYQLFKVETSEFWKSHYTFDKSSKPLAKKLSNSFIDLLIINTIIPLKFSYSKSKGESIEDAIFNLIKELKIEKNTITERYLGLRPFDKSALTSQSLIQLKTEYCDKNKCLQCAIGNQLILKN